MNSCLTRLNGRCEVRAVGGEAEHRDRETHLRIDECADIATIHGGLESPYPVVDGCDAGVDEADRVQACGGVHLALGGVGRPDPGGATGEPADDGVIGSAPANDGLHGVLVRVDETGHDDHPAPVDHGCSRRLREVHPHVRNFVAYDEDVGVLELSEDAPVSEARIHGEHERGVPNQIAASERLTRARSHDPDNQCQHDPDVRASHVCTPSVVKPPLRPNIPASMISPYRPAGALWLLIDIFPRSPVITVPD